MVFCPFSVSFSPYFAKIRYDVYMQRCCVGISFDKISAVEVVLYLWAYKILSHYSHYFCPDFGKIRYMGVYIR